MKNFRTKEKAAFIAALLLAPPLCMTAQEPLSSCMEQLKERYRIHFVYDASLQHLLDTTRTMATQTATLPLKDALHETFDGSRVLWHLRGRHVILKAASVSQEPHAEAIKKFARKERDS